VRVLLLLLGTLLAEHDTEKKRAPQLRLRANKLPSPNHCESRDFLLVNENLSLRKEEQKRRNKNLLDTELTQTESQREESGESQFQGSLWRATLCAVVQKERHGSQSGVFRPSLISPRRPPDGGKRKAGEPNKAAEMAEEGGGSRKDSHRRPTLQLHEPKGCTREAQ